ncbi:methyltransferase domain-containing protein [Streptomyces sp. NPDC021098]|uniref:methyltransferase domain-containing protein n=1 Tax=unclassified Streptomyces TaxID=2593676 RepID=UPI00378ECF3E
MCAEGSTTAGHGTADYGATDYGTADYWDAAAAGFDDEPDHGLRDPAVREAWARRLREWLPGRPSDVLDLGCGTGSLARLAAEQGHRVTGVDRSAGMAGRARAKLTGTDATVLVGDAAAPPVGEGRFDVVLARHLLWLLPGQEAVLRRWARLLRPGGQLVLIEGRWGESDPVGLAAGDLLRMVEPLASRTHVEQLAPDAALWGRPVRDERYVLRAALAPPRRHAEIVDVHLLLRRGDRLLLARRAGTGYADGLLHAPSGHVEDGEDVRTAVLREAEEEIGVRLTPDEVRVALVMQHKSPTGSARTGWFFEARLGEGGPEPVNREPDKCSEIGWFALDALPEDMVAYCRAGVEAYRAGERFATHWHEPGDAIAFAPAGPDRLVVLKATE